MSDQEQPTWKDVLLRWKSSPLIGGLVLGILLCQWDALRDLLYYVAVAWVLFELAVDFRYSIWPIIRNWQRARKIRKFNEYLWRNNRA
ncbi:membrane protein [Gordonia phage LilyPad]|nr:membrane protein [Gordonia phage LilyPad]